MKLTCDHNIEMPRVPNFLRGDTAVDHLNCVTYPIQSFSDEDLRKVGEAWTAALIEKARERRP